MSRLGRAALPGAGTLTNPGTAFTNFGSLQFDGGAQWLVSANTAAGAGKISGMAISGSTPGDTIDLTGFVAATETLSANTPVLTDAGAVDSTTLHSAGAFRTGNFATTDVTFGSPSYHIISGSYSSGITLTNQGDNPVSVLSTGTIAVANGTALYGTGGGSNTWTIANSGSVSGGSGSGITLGKAGTTVSSGLVSNGSTIDGGIGVQIYGPGAVTNASGGSITGYAGGGIIIAAGLGTVSNAGSLTGGAFGVHELAGGSVANQSGGAITSTYRYGVRIEGGTGTVSNLGIILGVSAGVMELSGGSVTNAAGEGITASSGVGVAVYGSLATLVNAGAISAATFGVRVDAGGSVTNISTGTITGTQYGILSQVVPVSIINAGLVQGSVGDFNQGAAGAALTNSGTIIGTSVGVYYQSVGSVTNQVGGSILSTNGTAILFRVSARGTVVNAGTIIGGATAVSVLDGSTLTNAGTIDANSGSGTAVVFAGGATGTSRLIVDPGATFLGTVTGDGVLELASLASAGTLTDLGTAFTNFGSLQFDDGAQWLVSGSTAAGAGKLGSIAIGGFTFGDTIDLTGFVAATETFSANTLVLKDAGAAHSTTLHIAGAFRTGNFATTDDKNGGTDITFGIPSYHVISGSYSSGITLTSQAANPVSVSTGTIAVASGPALYGTGGGSKNWTIDNSGSISSASKQPSDGIQLGASGTPLAAGIVTNEAGGLISGTKYGVGIYGAIGSVSNLSGGSITGNNSGVLISGGAGTVDNFAAISGGVAIYEGTGGSVTNQSSGVITGAQGVARGVWINGGVGTIVNAGSIYGSNDGVVEDANGSVTNQSGGAISSAYYGVSQSAGGSVTNQDGGSISGGRYGVLQSMGGSVTNQGSGSITGSASGIKILVAAGTVDNSGAVSGNVGVYEVYGGSVTNRSAGAITGTTGAAILIGTNASASVANAGSLLGGSSGVLEQAGGSVTNQSGGAITSTSGFGVRIEGGAGTVSNLGIILGVSVGVMELSGGSVTNAAGEGITASSGVGVAVYGSLATVVNAGAISAATFGVRVDAGGSVTNISTGTITGTQYGILSQVVPVSIINAGLVQGSVGDFNQGAAGGTLNNSGTIIGTSVGVYHQSVGSVTNQVGGSILSVTGKAIQFGAAGTIVNAGTIIGGATAVSVLDGSTLTNAGTIGANSASGTAVVFAGGAAGTSRLIVRPGATFLGTVTGDGVLELASPASVGTLANLGTAFTNFGSLQFDDGAQWLVSGSTAAGAGKLGSIAIGGFTFGDTIDLTGFVAATETFSANTLVLKDAGAVHSTTLHIAGAFKTGNFVTTDDKNGGTDITFGVPSYHIISGSYASGITLTNQAANPVSVLSSGTIAVASGPALYGTGGGSKNWTIDNSGSISSASKQPSDGIQLGASGTSLAAGIVTNEAGGLISGTKYGVGIYGTTGSVSNLSGGSITGINSGVLISGGAGTVVNAGTISGGIYSILDLAGGSVTNRASGVIAGGGINIRNGAGTVVNAGTVGAVTFLDTLTSNLLVVAPGAVFTGIIAGATGAVELTSAISTGTLAGFDGSTITNFGSLEFDPGARWTISGNASAAGLGTIAIGGFTLGDTIDLTGFVAVSHTFDNVNDVLTLTGTNSAHSMLHIQGDFVTKNFVTASDLHGGTDVTVIATCYAAGTRIATPQGEAAVEDLRVGNLVLTVSGRTQPIVWIGHRHVDFRRHPNRQRILPVRITAHAFGQGRPKRDVLLSPDHMVFVDDVLIPIRHLVNGRSITQIERDTITYYHVELPRHDVLLAEGLPAESYLDAGARGAFGNHDGVVQLHPDFASLRDDWAMLWEVRGYAPLVVVGEQLDRTRRELGRQADVLALGNLQRTKPKSRSAKIAA